MTREAQEPIVRFGSCRHHDTHAIYIPMLYYICIYTAANLVACVLENMLNVFQITELEKSVGGKKKIKEIP